MILRAPLMLFSTNVLPYFGVVLARRRAMKLRFGADVLAVVDMNAYGPRASGNALSPFYAALHPVGVGIGVFIYAALRSAYVTLAKAVSSGGAPSTPCAC